MTQSTSIGSHLRCVAVASVILAVGWVAGHAAAAEPEPPAIGEKAPDFELATLTGKSVRLAELTPQGPVVLVVLRGYPGYQCPICSRQVSSLIGAADELRARGARVVMIYPGPAGDLDERAREFITGKTFPDGYYFLLDPDYRFTNAYGLRWQAPRETAYPSTFVIDRSGEIAFAKISQSHGDRAAVHQILQALKKSDPPADAIPAGVRR